MQRMPYDGETQMPITKSAKKALRQSASRRILNDARKKAMREAVKKARKTPALETLAAAYQMLDKAAKNNVIHKNRAARLKSRLAQRMAKSVSAKS